MKNILTIILFNFSYVIADIEINNSSVDFGPVSIGETKLDTIEVANNLGIAQVVTFVGIASPFSVTPNGQEIGANQSMEFILSFNPIELGDYNLEVEVDGNKVPVAWAFERPVSKGGRSFGTTLGHFHRNFKIEAFRRMIVNAILWSAHVQLPLGGAPVAVTDDDLQLPPEPEN